MAISIQIRRDTADNWTANSSVILADGEIAATINQTGLINDFKIGNGVSAWGELPYIQTGSIYTDTDISSIINNIAVISNNIGVIETNINTNNNNIEELDELIDSISGNITSLTEGISSTNTNVETISTGLQNLTTAVNTIRDSNIPSINTTLESLTTTVDVLAQASSNLVSLDEVNQAIENSISSLPTSSEIQYLSSEISSDISNLTRINGEITTKINNLSSDISLINTITVQYLSSNISSKVSEADVENIISAKADKTTLETISSYIYGNINTAIDELSINSLTNSDIINGNNVKIGDNYLSSILSTKLDKDTPFSVTELSVGNLIISGNTISTNGKTYTLVSGESNTIATLEDVTTISTNASKLSGITITPANISDPTTIPPTDIGYTDDTVWSISKDGEEEFNTIWAKLDYYNGSYQPTRLPSYNEVRTYVASEINSHNTSGDSHPSIISSINTISAAVSGHYTYIDESFNNLSGYIGQISSDIRGLSSHYNESDEKFSTITSNIRDISSITITVPTLSTTIETVSSSLNNKITQLASINASEHDALADNFSDLSSDLDYVKYRVVALDEARWIPYTSEDSEKPITTNILTTLSGDSVSFDGNMFGFYFSPKYTLNDVNNLPESINNFSLKTLSITTTSTSNWYTTELSALDVIAIAYIYDNNNIREIGRSLNSINILREDEYIFAFHNCIASLSEDSIVYIKFENYATGDTITQKLPLVLYSNSNNKNGIITDLENIAGNTSVFPITDIVIDYVADVVVEIDNIKAETNEIKNDTVSVFNEITSMLSADNVVLGWSSDNSVVSAIAETANSKLLTVNTAPLYETVENEQISCFPYTGTTEVLLRDNIRVTGTPGIGSIKNGDVLKIGDNVTDILKQMLQVELPITVINPTGSFKLYNTDDNGNNPSELTTGRYLQGTKHNFLAIFNYNDGIYIKDPNATGTDCSAYAGANVAPNGYKIIMEYLNSSTANYEFTSDSVSADKTGWLFSTDTNTLRINGYITYNTANTPVNNIGKQTSDTITGNTISVGSITLTPFGYGYMGYDVGTASINSSTITALPKISDNLNWLTNGKSFNLTLPAGASCKRFIIAYPDSLNDISKIEYVEDGNTNYTSNFSKSTVQVTIVNNKTLNYKVYTYGTSTDSFWNGPVTFKITL
jgi:predicted  nucleic acid-binding Zn-ribbon protein